METKKLPCSKNVSINKWRKRATTGNEAEWVLPHRGFTIGADAAVGIETSYAASRHWENWYPEDYSVTGTPTINHKL